MSLYDNGVIYKLCCNDPTITDFYIGSTTNFRQRKHVHRRNSTAQNKSHLKIYIYIKANGGFSNWNMVEIEKYKAFDRRDLLRRERYWMDELKPTLNGNVPFSSPEQKKLARERYNKSDKKKEQSKRYKDSDAYKQKIENEKIKVTCECGEIISKRCLSRHLKREVHRINMSNLKKTNNK